jgi:uncharacterized protein YdhG (YjbR/CyaY superfamily)
MITNKNTPKDIDDYIASFSKNVQEILQKLRETIRKAAPEALETINYAMPTFKLHGNLVHFAAYKSHIGFYPAPSGIAAFKNDLKGFKTSKGAIQFPIDKPLPFDIITKVVKYRVTENKERAEKKAKKNKLQLVFDSKSPKQKVIPFVFVV